MRSNVNKRQQQSLYRESDSYQIGKLESRDILYQDDFDLTYKDQYETEKDFSGIGPVGYKRSTEKIKDEAFTLLKKDSSLDASQIVIEVKDRILILHGKVSSRTDKRLAERIVEEVSGIDDVYNFLTINKRPKGWIPGLDRIQKSILGGVYGSKKKSK